MSFGSRDPYSYNPPSGVIHTPLDSEFICPICSRDVSEPSTHSGKVQLAPCVVPKYPSPLYQQYSVFACAACYQSWYKLDFKTIEEFREYRASRRRSGRPKVDKPEKQAVTKVVVPKVNNDSMKILRKIYDMLCPLFQEVGATHEGDVLEEGIPEVQKDGSPEVKKPRTKHEPLSDDDIEAGMTDEQRARMDQAVIDAVARADKIVVGG